MVQRNEDGELVSFAEHIWKKRRAREKLVCWETQSIINIGDFYYEYQINITLYGTQLEMQNPIVTEREYFKQKLNGFAGFKYYDKN